MWKLAKRSWGLLATLATMIYWFSTNSLETTVSEADSYLFKNLKTKILLPEIIFLNQKKKKLLPN